MQMSSESTKLYLGIDEIKDMEKSDLSLMLGVFKGIRRQGELVLSKMRTAGQKGKAPMYPGLVGTLLDNTVFTTVYAPQILALVKLYNSSLPIFAKLRQDSRLNLSSIEFNRLDLNGSLMNVIANSTGAIEYLESIISKIPAEQVDKLSSILVQIEPLQTFSKPMYLHLKSAIRSYENGEYIGASLIAGKMVTYCVDQIPGKDDLEKADYLVNENLIKKNMKELVPRAARRTRNLYSHDINAIPTSNDSIGLLSDAVSLCLIMVKVRAKNPSVS